MKPDGGPAFPSEIVNITDNNILYAGHVVPPDARGNAPGMSLRDYFAAAAMSGALAHPGADISYGLREVAKRCYAMADAMLAERDK